MSLRPPPLRALGLFASLIVSLLLPVGARAQLHAGSLRFGDEASSDTRDIATDAEGNVLVAGRVHGPTDFGGGTLAAGHVLLKLDAFGSHVGSRSFGPALGLPNGVACDTDGNVFLAGYFYDTLDLGEVAIAGNGAGSLDFGGGPLEVAGGALEGGNDVFVVRLAPAPVAVPEGLLAGLRLRPARPNPFNPRTTVRFDVPAPGRVLSLRIYDVRGRRVRSLHEGFVGGGPHERVWDGLDDQGRAVASGSYVCRLESAGQTRRMGVTLVR